MKWLTLTEIGRRARSKKGALEVSWQHWNQLYMATAKELREEYEKTVEDLVSCDYCGLCTYHKRKQMREFDYCGECIFGDFCEVDLWATANSAIIDWYSFAGDWHAWKCAAKALRDKLKELMQ